MSDWERIIDVCGFTGSSDRIAVLADIIRYNDFEFWRHLAGAIDPSEWLRADELDSSEMEFLRHLRTRAPTRLESYTCKVNPCIGTLVFSPQGEAATPQAHLEGDQVTSFLRVRAKAQYSPTAAV